MSGPQGSCSTSSVENPWSGRLHENPSPIGSSNVSRKGKEKVEDASRIPSLSASHNNEDLSGLEQSLDEEFGIPSIKTPSARRIKDEHWPLGSDPSPQRLGRTRNLV